MRPLLAQEKNAAGITLTLLALAIFVYAAYVAQGFRDVSRWFPVGVSLVGIALSVVVMLWELGIVTVGRSESLEGDATEGDTESSMTAARGFLTYMAWLVVLAAALMTFGAPIAVFAWLLLFFHFRSKESWIRSLLYALGALLAIAVLAALLHLFLPSGSVVPSGTWIPHVNVKF